MKKLKFQKLNDLSLSPKDTPNFKYQHHSYYRNNLSPQSNNLYYERAINEIKKLKISNFCKQNQPNIELKK